MYPELFHIGPLTIRSFGLMMALAFFAGVLYIRWITRRDGKQFDHFLTVAYIMIFGGLIGARLAYVLLHLEEFSGHWLDTFNPFHSDRIGIAGLNLYGGVLVGVFGSWLYCRIKKLNVLEIFDYFAPTLGIGIGIARIGCFLNGCCWGTPTDLPWGVHFPEGSMPTYCYGDQALHPSQIYSSLYGWVMFLILHWLLRRKGFHGQVTAVAFMIEAVARFGIEYVRYYENAMYFEFWGIQPTFNQFVSLSLFLLGLGIYLVQRKRGRVET